MPTVPPTHPHLTARQLIEIIKHNIGTPWRETTVDTFKAGDPDDVITGVAVTMVPTLDMLQKAATAGCNLILAHEPVYFWHTDEAKFLEREHDAVFAAKRNFINEHRLILWRIHDHWHWRHPDGILLGMVNTLGWQGYQKPDSEPVFTLPETTVEQLASQLKDKLGIRTLRVVGDGNLKVTKIALSPGFPGFDNQRHLLQRDDVEVLVMGEGHEWEIIAYAADAATAQQRKTLIVLGHVPSEQGGMEEFARWLKPFAPQLTIEYIPTLEPFWSPV